MQKQKRSVQDQSFPIRFRNFSVLGFSLQAPLLYLAIYSALRSPGMASPLSLSSLKRLPWLESKLCRGQGDADRLDWWLEFYWSPISDWKVISLVPLSSKVTCRRSTSLDLYGMLLRACFIFRKASLSLAVEYRLVMVNTVLAAIWKKGRWFFLFVFSYLSYKMREWFLQSSRQLFKTALRCRVLYKVRVFCSLL